MKSLSPELLLGDLHVGPTVDLDDFPYVHMMRRIDEELNKLGEEGVFFWSPERPFRNPIDWGTLIHLLNEDFADLFAEFPLPASAGMWLLKRFEAARLKARGPSFLPSLDLARGRVALAIEAEAQKMAREKAELCGQDLTGKTIVIEFARGGPEGAKMPLPAPLGFQYSLGQLSTPILEKARVLYVDISPEESKHKNLERADKSDPGSILCHGVPDEVMEKDYGCVDIEHLTRCSGQPDRLRVVARGKVHLIPVARFDNKPDLTTFVRKPPEEWTDEEKTALHTELKWAMDVLAEA